MIALIVAMTNDHVIGNENKLLWSIPDEMKHFRTTTSGTTILMGRKTYESIGRPLPKRTNVVISRTMEPHDDVIVCDSLQRALEVAEEHGKDTFIIGGAQIYKLALDVVDKMYISYIKKDYEGDAYFPEFDEDEWTVETEEDHDEWTLKVYARKS